MKKPKVIFALKHISHHHDFKELSKSNKQSRCGYGASGNELSKMVLDEARNDDRIGNPQSQDINGNCPLRRKRGPYQITPDKIRKEVITRVVEGKETYKKVKNLLLKFSIAYLIRLQRTST